MTRNIHSSGGYMLVSLLVVLEDGVRMRALEEEQCRKNSVVSGQLL